MSNTKKVCTNAGDGKVGFGFNLNPDNLLFYDIECFKYNSLVVFKSIDNEEVAHFWCPDFDKIADLIRGKTLVGYNNYYYDDKMLSVMIRTASMPFKEEIREASMQKIIKRANDDLIAGEDPHFGLNENIVSIDCFQQIDVSKPSLKLVEGNMYKSILESSVDFTIDRPLTEEEKEEVLKYCRYDVENTIAIYKLREKSYFLPKNSLLEMLKRPSAGRWNTTSISGFLLMQKVVPHWTKLRLGKMREYGKSTIPPEVWDAWMEAEAKEEYKVPLKDVYSMGCKFTFGSGGLHGVQVGRREFRNVKLLDVGSMYPSMIVLLNALEDSTSVYDGIRRHRLEVKHQDKILSDALKLVLNSVYGNFKNEYSILYNPMASFSVCIYGQMALYDLCLKLDKAGYQIMNANTDGVGFVQRDENPEPWEPIQKEWEQLWGLYLELDEFDWWYQKDVSNYIATRGDKVKVKGKDLKKYPFDPGKGVHNFFKDNNTRILSIVMVEYMLARKNGRRLDIVTAIMDHIDQPELFQFVLKAGHTYKGVVDKDGNKLQHVNRVFAVRKNVPHTKIYKQRMDGGLVNFPDVPEQMMVWNDDVAKLKDFEWICDVKYYRDLVVKKLEGWGWDV